MANVNVENIDELVQLFEQKMGFPADSAGLEMTEEQLVNFMLLCHKAEYGYDEEEDYEEEEMPMHDDDMKVKVVKLKGGDMQGMMDEILNPMGR
tara:strand:- start:1627 stop:1908 length:282 start_codon:yes stop_codon:yes gene_type:complete